MNASLARAEKQPAKAAPSGRAAAARAEAATPDIGNLAIQSLFRAGAVDAKLTIGRPDDPQEEEADKVADRVMRKPASGAGAGSCTCASGGQTCEECQKKEPDQAGAPPTVRRIAESSASTSDASAAPSIVAQTLGGAGRPLEASTRADMEGRFGRDFGDVRIHVDHSAAKSAAAIDALAYTAGNQIVFGQGRYAPQTDAGRRLLAHELAHVEQWANVAPAAPDVSSALDSAEREARQVSDAVSADRPAPAILAHPTVRISRQEDDPDHPPAPAPPSKEPDVPLEPLSDWNPIVDFWDPTTFWTPPDVSREQIASRLYSDPTHFGGFDIIGDKHVRMRNLEGVADDVATPMRAALDIRLQTEVDSVIGILMQRRINEADEWRLLNTTVWWSSRSDFTNTAKRSYFDAYLDLLDTHRLTEWGLFGDTTRTGSEWLVVEAEEKEWAIYPLLARSGRGTPRSRHTDEELPQYARQTGPLTTSNVEPFYRGIVGTYEFRSGEDRFGIEEEQHGTAPIYAGDLIVTETSANAAEIALRNSPRVAARVMIPGGDGKFYGYAIERPHFWDPGYVQPADPKAQRLQNFWWHYPGTIFIPGGTFQPEFGVGGQQERAQRADILNRALAGGLEQLRGLDFDVLSLLSLDQRVTVLGLAAGSNAAPDTSFVSRALYSTPSADFPILEHRLSTNGTMLRLLNLYSPEGGLAVIGRIFTLKSLESMQVPGETLTNLPEFVVGFDEEGFYHYGTFVGGEKPSRLMSPADIPQGGAVGIGQEPAAPGETPGAIMRATAGIQPAIFRLGGSGLIGMGENFVRGMAQTLVVDDGPPKGPYLPTQLVRVRFLGPNPQTRVVSILEAIGLLELPGPTVLQKMISTHLHGFMVLMAATGLAEAFGPALGGAILEGSGARAVGTVVAETAATAAGRAAIINAGLIAGMEAVDRNRDTIAATPEGRAFLDIYDVAMVIWISRDVARLIGSGLVPRLVEAADRVIALPGALREAIMPLRAEAEAWRRAVARYRTPAEAMAAATSEGLTMAAGSEGRPGFLAMLRVTRGEVAAERLTDRIAGTSVERAGGRVLGRLEGAINRADQEAATITGTSPEAEKLRAAALRRSESAASARFAVAERAAQLRPEAREAFLNAVDGVVATRPNAVASLTDLLTAAAQSRAPNVFIGEVRTLVSRPGISDDALRVLGAKVRQGRGVLDLAWLNRTSISDETLDFLGRDARTPWNLYRETAADPNSGSLIRGFRSAARGAGAEIVAAPEAARLGSAVRRQVRMGSSEIDYEITVAGRPHGFEIKGWTADTWESALDAAIQRMNRRALTDVQREDVKKIDSMIRQLKDASTTTGRAPYLGFTDALSDPLKARLRRVLEANGLGATRFVGLSESKIKEAAARTIGEAVGVPAP
jgi:hypothetical protein